MSPEPDGSSSPTTVTSFESALEAVLQQKLPSRDTGIPSVEAWKNTTSGFLGFRTFALSAIDDILRAHQKHLKQYDKLVAASQAAAEDLQKLPARSRAWQKKARSCLKMRQKALEACERAENVVMHHNQGGLQGALEKWQNSSDYRATEYLGKLFFKGSRGTIQAAQRLQADTKSFRKTRGSDAIGQRMIKRQTRAARELGARVYPRFKIRDFARHVRGKSSPPVDPRPRQTIESKQSEQPRTVERRPPDEQLSVEQVPQRRPGAPVRNFSYKNPDQTPKQAVRRGP